MGLAFTKVNKTARVSLAKKGVKLNMVCLRFVNLRLKIYCKKDTYESGISV